MHVEHPAVLGGLLAAIALLVLFGRRLQIAVSTWRLLTAAAIVSALCGISIDRGETAMAAVVALDRSASMAPVVVERAWSRVKEFTTAMRRDDRLGIVVFGAHAIVASPLLAERDLARPTTIVDPGGTNIEAAIRTALAALPADRGRRIVLISDGQQTSGDARGAAADAAAAGVPVDVLVPPADSRQLARATRVVSPSDVYVREPLVVSVDIEGPPRTSGRVTLLRDNAVAADDAFVIDAHGNATVTFDDVHDRAGIHEYRAVVDDSDPETGLARPAILNVAGERHLLYVSAGSARITPTISSFRVTSVAPQSVPSTTRELADYDAVVLDDVPADRLTAAQTSALAEHVQKSGAGLIVLGEPSTLDPAGYPTTPLGALLPVDLRPRAGRRASSLDLVVMFDRSGSMSELADGVPKIERAREAVRRIVDVLPVTDAVGVIAFNTSPSVIAPLAASPNLIRVGDELRRTEPIGATAIAPATELALRWFDAARSRGSAKRQILLISDGRTSPEDAARLRSLVRGAGVPVSVVAIGADANQELLNDLATTSGGRAFYPADTRDLPLIAAREAARSSSGGVVAERFVPHGAAHTILAGIDTQSFPSLAGYVVSAAKPAAAAVLSSHLEDPILGAWQTGIGRTAVFTADFRANASAGFLASPHWPLLWSHTVQWAARRTNDPLLRVALAERNGLTSLAIDADADTMFDHVSAIVRYPDGVARTPGLMRTAPDRFEAPITGPISGTYVVSLQATDLRGEEHRLVRGVYWDAAREYAGRPANRELLQQIADISGGRALDATDSPFATPRAANRVDISGWFAAAALLLFILELVVDRFEWRWFERVGRMSAAHVFSRP